MNPEINPYAAPLVGDAPQPFAGAGVGVWRDGDEVVMHRQATLPPYCVVTGAATEWRYDFELAWSESDKWFVQRLKLGLPLSDAHYHSYRARLRFANAAFHSSLILVLTLVLLCFHSYFTGTADGFVAAIAFVSLVMLVISFVLMAIAESRRSKLLKLRRVQGHYLWLRGPNPPFLERLPAWPYGK